MINIIFSSPGQKAKWAFYITWRPSSVYFTQLNLLL